MLGTAWRRLQPRAPRATHGLLDAKGGPVQPPIRAEIFGPQRFAQHGRSLGATQSAVRARLRSVAFFPRLADNMHTLRAAHAYIGGQAAAGYAVSPAAEWLLDNFQLIEAQLEQIHRELPRNAVRALPVLQQPPLAGLPRIYGVAWAFVAHTDGAFDEDLLVQFLSAYQDSRALTLAEMWALPTTLRVLLLENLRRLAEREAAQMAAREVANLCSDRVLAHDDAGPVAGTQGPATLVAALGAWLQVLQRRGVGDAFLARLAQRLRDRPVAAAVRAWLDQALPNAAALQTQHGADQAADNLSMSNAVSSLRAIGDTDWSDLVARASTLMRLMLAHPLFEAEHAGTRDQTLHAIERLARRSGRSELAVAQALLTLMRPEPPGSARDTATPMQTPGHWLQGAGRDTLARALGLREPLRSLALRVGRHAVLPVYLGALGAGTAALVLAVLRADASPVVAPAWAGLTGSLWAALGVLLMLLPASEAVVAVVNRLVSEWVRPTRLPRLALMAGIPLEHRVMVAIPTMLSDSAAVRELAHRLHLHHLANPESHAQFALLTDHADADQEHLPADATLLALACAEIDALNLQHPSPPDAAPRFVLLHRPRRFCDTEQRWIGWERKRGKLLELLAALATGHSTAFAALGERSRIEPGTRHLLTLDSDTQLPPGRLRALVCVAAHPRNQPHLGAGGRHVDSGYAILQPHVVTPLPAQGKATPFHWLFAGHSGIDPYSAASSEVYQDLFAEGSFCGKGLLQVQAVHAVLGTSLPEGCVLSHDLLEGSLARCAAVTDISLIEDPPFQADVASARVHRWTRGDWQLLPFLFQPRRWPLRAVHRWKMLDNLRRSLVAPASLALLGLALAGGTVAPALALALVFAAYTAGPLMGALAGLVPSRHDVSRRHFYGQAGTEWLRALCGGLWWLWQLGAQALLAMDAVLRSLWRLGVSRRHLLQWTPFAAVQAGARGQLGPLLRRHANEPLLAAALLGVLWAVDSPHMGWALLLALWWASSPLGNWWVSRVRRPASRQALSLAQQQHLEALGRDTWRLFERCVGPDDLHLPPDNLQVLPQDVVAHRTSPTNIGLYLLSAACARQFGWIGTQDLLARLEATLATLATLQRHRGHFLNWYDTQSGAPLMPAYVSTVDSGNLSGHLLAVAQACRALATAPFDEGAGQRALAASHARLRAPHAARAGQCVPGPATASLLAQADPLAACRADPVGFLSSLAAAQAELDADPVARAQPLPPAKPTPEHRETWLLADHLATLRSAALDLQARALEALPPSAALCGTAPLPRPPGAAERLLAAAGACEALAWQADFGFLYHRKRHLFHIGWRLAEQQLDAGFYDLLASESRLASLLAIAKGDVPVNHWAALGRPFFADGARVGLRSWSGSMFEYLMPSLVLDEPPQSVLCQAGVAALGQQRAFGLAHGVPWGTSESAHAGRDHTLAYQYAPHGVPALALRRTPPDELVMAPYASVLAAQIDPRAAQRNLLALQALQGRGRYGLIEALDFSAAFATGSPSAVPVATYMSHHQGMSIVALANVLLDGVARRWGMANAHVQAVASLLHERVPREVPALPDPPGPRPLPAASERAAGGPREVLPGAAAVEPTHLLSNGRYQVDLRANGAGSSRWGRFGLTRWRDDALADACGHFFYLRWDRQPQAVSITQHPAPDAAAHYSSHFHADRLVLDAAWPDLHSRLTVWVSPEDDIEFRQVELHNLGERVLDIDLISAFEPTLAEPRADEAHPAFSNLFVRAAWRAAQQALVFERTPRLDRESPLHVAHFLAEGDPQVLGLQVQADRQRWAGRNHAASHPLARVQPPPDAPAGEHSVALDTGLDPMAALGLRLWLAPGAQVRVVFGTAASDDAGVLNAVVDKYRQPSHVQRASLMSATMSDVRWRALRLAAEPWADIQTLSTALLFNLTRPQQAAAGEICDRSLLWRFGLSGDRPLLLVTASAPQGLGLLRSLAQALRVWAWGGVACDMVVVNAEATSYLSGLQGELQSLRDHLATDLAAAGTTGRTALFVLRAEELSVDEASTLHHLARVQLDADGRPLQHHVQTWRDLHEQALQARQGVSTAALLPAPTGHAPMRPPEGEFIAPDGAFRVQVASQQRPARPWANVLANRRFGSLVTEAGGGFTWAGNSRLNQLTAWSNDPVADPPSCWWLLQDEATRQTWSVTPSAWAAPGLPYTVTHGQGETTFHHRCGDLEVLASWCVDADASAQQVRLRLMNHGPRTRHLRLVGLVEWMMGASRADRATTTTRMHALRSDKLQGLVLLCTQRERTGGFGGGTAFLASATDQRDAAAGSTDIDWTCDRREAVDARGHRVLPDHFGQRSGKGLDPCAALSLRLRLASGSTAERVFLLGHADNPQAARDLAARTAAMSPTQRVDTVRQRWNTLLGATQVATPDPLFDVLVNRWLLYQSVSCRLWAKAGFYQAGGATGFRDQLQDTLALAWAAPNMLREQIVLCASRQFTAGDVQHWWHAPGGAGVRTHISDDLLWLPHALLHHLKTGGDAALLDQQVAFIEGGAIPEGAEDAYDTPRVSHQVASVYEHAALAIDHSLRVGVHGLPLMGSGDWNDGMNRVGHGGRGESVWLGWFACALVAGFAPLARQRGDSERAQRWEDAAAGWQGALLGQAWDGHWYLRAFFDDGQALGGHAGAEARIDLIAQAWAVLSGVAPPQRQREAMAAVQAHLADEQAGLLRLLHPPLQQARPNAGYIQAYPPGVRENGGQYAHAAVWALMAQAELASGAAAVSIEQADTQARDTVYRWFTWLSPAHRAAHPVHGPLYALEPYVMAGDICSAAPRAGRGGWSWYTGAAAWMHRAAVESVFGLTLCAQTLRFHPCLPSHWPRAELTLTREGRRMHFVFLRGAMSTTTPEPAPMGATLLLVGQALHWATLGPDSRFVVPLRP